MFIKDKKVTVLFVILLLLSVLAGCGGSSEESVYAQSVAVINNNGGLGINNRFAGLTVSGNTQEVKLDETMTLDEVLVEVGDLVNEGDVLFTYNNEALTLNIEQLKLEIESMKNTISDQKNQIKELEKERGRVSNSEKLRYTLEIQGLEADIREAEYNISSKENELKSREEMVSDTSVRAKLSGRVTDISKNGEYDDMGNPKPFITIVETGNLRIKGTINELNRGSLSEGDEVIIRSRTDDGTWYGFVESIDWENPQKDNNNYFYYGADEMTSSSKYPFYVTVDDTDGLIIGQHIYIETGVSEDADAGAVRLPSYYIMDADTSPWVWAVNGKDRLEKREVTLGIYDEMMDEYVIDSGITLDDYVSFPEEDLKAGMHVIKVDDTYFEPEESFPVDDGMLGEDFSYEEFDMENFDFDDAEIYEDMLIGEDDAA